MIEVNREILFALMREAIERYDALLRSFVGNENAASLAAESTVSRYLAETSDPEYILCDDSRLLIID